MAFFQGYPHLVYKIISTFRIIRLIDIGSDRGRCTGQLVFKYAFLSIVSCKLIILTANAIEALINFPSLVFMILTSINDVAASPLRETSLRSVKFYFVQ